MCGRYRITATEPPNMKRVRAAAAVVLGLIVSVVLLATVTHVKLRWFHSGSDISRRSAIRP